MNFFTNLFISLFITIIHTTFSIKGVHKEFGIQIKTKTNKLLKINKIYNGYDERYNEPTDSLIVEQISNYVYKKTILDKLVNEKISIPLKIDIIEEFYRQNTTKAYNLEAGGLYDDWKMDI